VAVEPVEPVAWPSSPWRGRRARGAVPCFQFASAANARGETQQNFKNTYSKRNNIS